MRRKRVGVYEAIEKARPSRIFDPGVCLLRVAGAAVIDLAQTGRYVGFRSSLGHAEFVKIELLKKRSL